MSRQKRASPQTWRKACVQDEWWRNKPCKRIDIGRLQIHNTKIMIGGKHRREYGPYVEQILEENFTPKEIARVKNLYVETNPKNLGKGVGGSNEHFDIEGQEKAAIIRMPRRIQGKDVVGGEEALTHEAIHALRNAMGRYVKDIDKDESTTQLETICRISKDGMNKAATGYYQYVPGLKTNDDFFDAMDQDRLLLNVRYEHKRKGNDAIHTTERKYPKSNISGIDLSSTKNDAEGLDRYFLIETKGKIIRLHERDNDGIVPSLHQTRKRLQKRYGKDAKIFEWKDGKKVDINRVNTIRKENKKKNNKKKVKKTVVKRNATKKKTSQKTTYPSVI